jgi:hypothetical protein
MNENREPNRISVILKRNLETMRTLNTVGGDDWDVFDIFHENKKVAELRFGTDYSDADSNSEYAFTYKFHIKSDSVMSTTLAQLEVLSALKDCVDEQSQNSVMVDTLSITFWT